ncbi:MAG TPA: methyltransferase domain-containing protein [Ktedonobacteraceae bacterium]|nr:methyltransferase domain-containing protein [Ktedonobacteraceae bacterium]
MGLMETEETKQFTFEAFAAHAFYTEINRSLVRKALAPLLIHPADQARTIIDMACGTGSVTRLIAEEIAAHHRSQQTRIIGVDPSAEALRLAQQSLEEMGSKADFFQGETKDLASIVKHVDAAFFCNAIHLIINKLDAFQQMAAILAPGGVLACNSAFYDGTNLDETFRFSRLWIRRAVGWLRKNYPDVRLSREAKATARQWLSPDEYISLLNQSGFSSVDATEERIAMPLDSLIDLGHYWLFIEGALPGAPLAIGAEALGSTVYDVAQELNMTYLPRMWLQIVATKG